jgi:hypothetical protein
VGVDVHGDADLGVTEDLQHDAGALQAAVRRVAVPWKRRTRKPAEAATRVKKHKHAGSSARVIAPRVRTGA